MAPSTANEELELGRWIVATVGEALGLRVYLDIIPQTAPMPAVRYTTNVREDLREVGRELIWSAFDILVVVADMTRDPGSLGEYAADLHAALDVSYGETDEVQILSCLRQYPFVQTEVREGDVYRSVGGMYRCLVQAKDLDES